jgi:hypothetical protein
MPPSSEPIIKAIHRKRVQFLLREIGAKPAQSQQFNQSRCEEDAYISDPRPVHRKRNSAQLAGCDSKCNAAAERLRCRVLDIS